MGSSPLLVGVYCFALCYVNVMCSLLEHPETHCYCDGCKCWLTLPHKCCSHTYYHTHTQCMHRFCSECIQKSLRLTRTQCPSCRIHVPSRRNLRNDEAFDSLIAVFYPNLQNYEAQQDHL